MQYSYILNRAWQITWEWKGLWLVGLLGNLTYVSSLLTMLIGSSGATSALSLLLSIAVGLLALISQGALIAGVREVEEGSGATDFRRAWGAGARRFWTLLGIAFLTALPMVALAIVLSGLFVLLSLGILGGTSSTSSYLSSALLLIVGGIVLGIVLLVPSVILFLISTYAFRVAMLEERGWTDAFGAGWEILKENVGPSLMGGLVTLAIGIVAGLAISGPSWFLLSQAILSPRSSSYSLLPCLGAPLTLLGGILGLTVGTLAQVYVAALWTLIYCQLVPPNVRPVLQAVRLRVQPAAPTGTAPAAAEQLIPFPSAAAPTNVLPPPSTGAQALFEQAYALRDKGQFALGLAYCNMALASDPTSAEAHNLRGILLEEVGSKAEAIQAYRQALQLDPDLQEARDNLRDLEAKGGGSIADESRA